MLDAKGKMYIEDNDIIELMLANRRVKILPRNPDSYGKFLSECKRYGITSPFSLAEDSDSMTWNCPDEYKNLDIRSYILKTHSLGRQELDRVDQELELYSSKNLLDLLRFLLYFVSVLRINNIVYGVGRGSSIASYVLYLLGVHRIDSLKYNLDIKEFLK